MLKASNSFVDGVENWIKAVRANDFEQARTAAEFCVRSGELLTIHPDFIKCFTRHCESVHPADALSYVCQFLRCATEGRAAAVRRDHSSSAQ
jgi:hypothetical protein